MHFREWETINLNLFSSFSLSHFSHALWFVFIFLLSLSIPFIKIENKKDSISSQSENPETALNTDESYANLLKDADKLKLMLLAWNYQNSSAIRNNSNSADLNAMSSLWEQYQNALGLNVNKNGESGVGSPVSNFISLSRGFTHTLREISSTCECEKY